MSSNPKNSLGQNLQWEFFRVNFQPFIHHLNALTGLLRRRSPLRGLYDSSLWNCFKWKEIIMPKQTPIIFGERAKWIKCLSTQESWETKICLRAFEWSEITNFLPVQCVYRFVCGGPLLGAILRLTKRRLRGVGSLFGATLCSKVLE